MIFVKTAVSAATLALLLGTGALVSSALPASARMVCNNSGDCWHSDSRYNYDRQVGAQYHNDDWYFHQTWNDQRHYRDPHEGRGYYRSGVWIGF
ncbi:MAG TPA: hypothetical protein VNX61_00835 [Rhizomicrobium sp.]|nr:hypothetical protein [Rhizomicrobium sp.]